MWELVFGVINVLIALSFLPYLLLLYHRTERSFYLFGGVGIFLACLRQALRIVFYLYPLNSFIPCSAILLLLLTGILIFTIAALAKLVSELVSTTIIIGALPVVIVSLYILLGFEEVLVISNIGLFSFVCIMLFYISRKYSLSLNYLILGLAMIFLANATFQFQIIDTIYSEIVGIFGKLFLFIGVLQPRFKFLAYDMSGFMSAKVLATVDNEYKNDALVLLESGPESRRAEIKLFTSKLRENLSLGIRTILIVLYDLITFEDLAEFDVERDDLHIVRMLSRTQAIESQFVFQEHESVIRDDLDDLNIVLSEIIEKAGKEGITCEIFFYNLSVLINMHGGKRAYSFLISRLPQFKTKGVSFYAYLHPQNHDQRSEVAIFESIADKLQKI